MKNILTLIFIFIASLGAFSQTVFVAQDANGNGTSWADASGDLMAVLAAASPNSEIWVKEGTYLPTTCSDCVFNDRNQRFEIPDGVRIYGGFAGSESEISQRDIEAHPSILSGDINEDGTLGNNSFTVVYTKDVSAATIVDGFVISGGNADQNTAGLGTPPSSGGGWFNLGSTTTGQSEPTIRNCRFEGNHSWGYGGAMYNDGSFNGSANPIFENCDFIGNTSRFGGGGIYSVGSFEGQASPVFSACLFENNETSESEGGAIFNIGAEDGVANPTFSDCTFLNNYAYHDGGAMYNFGFKGNSSPELTDCHFAGNSAHAGGAVYNDGTFGGYSAGVFSKCTFQGNIAYESDGGAVYNSAFQGTCNTEFTDCLFENNNSAFAGGAMFNNGGEGVCNSVVSNCRFVSNLSDTYGGAMYNQGTAGNSSPIISNCLFEKNSALSAGAVYNLGANDGNANAFITNCTFYANQANVGGAVYCNAGENGTGTSSPTVRNCVFWENTASDIGDVFRIIWGTPTITHSLVDKNDCDDLYNGNGGFLTCGDGLIFNEDPLFADPASSNFHLLEDSPAIDFGNNDAVSEVGLVIDLDNLPRIHNGTVDMGVYEYGSTMGTAPVVLQQPISQSVCDGTAVSFVVSANGAQPIEYQWFRGGNLILDATEGTYQIPSASQNDEAVYTCEVTSSTGESTMSDGAVLTVNEPAEVQISITASQTEICEGEGITLIAAVEHGGSFPEIQWYLNENAFGGNISTFNIDMLMDGDVFMAEVVSSADCIVSPNASSNSVTINVESSLEATLSIAADVELPCEGQPLALMAEPVNGGNSPSYQWLVNGSPAGDDSPSFTYVPQSGDEVFCEMTSSKNCVVQNPVNSNVLLVETQEVLTLSAEISASVDTTICVGDEVVFTAETEHAGASASYDWKVNGISAGSNEAIFATTALEHFDIIICEVTSSLECIEVNPVISNEIMVSVDSCVVSSVEEFGEEPKVSVYPNPTGGKIFVKISGNSTNFTTNILNVHGQQLMSMKTEHPSTSFFRELNLTNFPQGVYYLQIVTDEYLMVERIVVER